MTSKQQQKGMRAAQTSIAKLLHRAEVMRDSYPNSRSLGYLYWDGRVTVLRAAFAASNDVTDEAKDKQS